jgi:Flp pilus assembly protein TadG
MTTARGRARMRGRGPLGQALAEFALTAPIFFLIMLAIMEAGRYVFYQEMLNSATRAGARYAIVHGSNAIDDCPSGPNPAYLPPNVCDPNGDNVKEVVQDAAIALALPATIVFTEPFWTTSNLRGETVTIAVTYTYPPLVPILPPITVTAESSLVINN